jgi:HAE1 family hydrophobic/amphiphilic exporter-1
MLFFLHSIRNSLIVWFYSGFNLNIYWDISFNTTDEFIRTTIAVVGILVDDAIVVLENIYRHMEMGKNRVRAAYDGTAVNWNGNP